MEVKVKIKIEQGSKNLEITALINTSYESATPQVLVPINLATQLGI